MTVLCGPGSGSTVLTIDYVFTTLLPHDISKIAIAIVVVWLFCALKLDSILDSGLISAIAHVTVTCSSAQCRPARGVCCALLRAHSNHP